MNLIDKKTSKILNAIIEKVEIIELSKLQKNKNFTFNWSLESNKEVYKIKIKEKKEILGLISLIDYPNEFRIHINLIESSKQYRGKNKSILHIPGCLIAFSCRLAFKKGYEGFVSLIPKTKLIKYYQSYGFVQIGTQMAIYGEIANQLILKHIGDEEI